MLWYGDHPLLRDWRMITCLYAMVWFLTSFTLANGWQTSIQQDYQVALISCLWIHFLACGATFVQTWAQTRDGGETDECLSMISLVLIPTHVIALIFSSVLYLIRCDPTGVCITLHPLLTLTLTVHFILAISAGTSIVFGVWICILGCCVSQPPAWARPWLRRAILFFRFILTPTIPPFLTLSCFVSADEADFHLMGQVLDQHRATMIIRHRSPLPAHAGLPPSPRSVNILVQEIPHGRGNAITYITIQNTRYPSQMHRRGASPPLLINVAPSPPTLTGLSHSSEEVLGEGDEDVIPTDFLLQAVESMGGARIDVFT